jgi:hypothetical protein
MIFNTGCGKPKPIVYPKWFNSISKDTTLFYYGVGEGRTKQEAVTNALNEIASKVSVSIQSSFSSITNVNKIGKDTNYIKHITNNVQNKVKKIEFSSYKVVKFKMLSANKYIVSIAVNRLDNAQLMLDKIDTNIEKYNQILNSNKLNVATRLKNYMKISDTIDKELLPNCFIVKSLNDSGDTDSSIKKLLDIKLKISNFKNGLVFNIVGNNISGYKEIISELLTKNKLTVARKSNIDIKLSVNESNINSLGYYIKKVKVVISIISNNKLIATKVIVVGGKSLANYSQAKEFALNNFKKKMIDKKVLKELLGI